ncbi:hypothetical protein H8B13_20465 [Hymenobacter sp. BT188]|uniref:hypothetical protein n=1 Tax=Hymenobacter sp. BT188 TaxID=2763504 RepID=UPI0016516C81|nr:hypothetical protein [Hymenobacter sp. BT188]MBC6609204.1 hypothetical protein [Hymenobacter sp. BT188]
MCTRYTYLLAAAVMAIAPAAAQEKVPKHRVFLFGNTAQREVPAARLAQLRQVLEQQTGPFTVVHLGDIVGNTGLAGKADSVLAQPARTRADALISLVKGLPQGHIYFLPGDKDWANSGPDGLKAVRRLEKYIEKQLPGQNAFLPSNGCPGPEVVDVAPLVRLVALNTPWFTHPYDRPEAPDTDCKTLTAEEFREQLQDILDETRGRNVLLAGHHPFVSNGEYGGHPPLTRHLLPPVLGTVYAAYRQNVGTPRDMANPRYQELRKELLNTLQSNPGVVYAAAHDYSLQLTPFQGNYHLVSGSLVEGHHVGAQGESLFNQREEGYSRLDYFADGTVKASFYVFSGDESPPKAPFTTTLFRSACLAAGPGSPSLQKRAVEEEAPTNAFLLTCATESHFPKTPKPDAPFQSSTVVAPGPQYRGTFSKRLFIGPVYRTSWIQPVEVPTLDLRSEKGGLRPFGKGGGRQTTALKLIAADSSEYVFRSVDKDVTNILPPQLRHSIAADILRDVTATAHPYSALVAGSLLDHTDILHARPRLFRLPDNQQLGPYRQQYAGLLGTLEDRPSDAKPNLPGFGGSEEVKRSFGLFRQLYKDHDNQVDALGLAKARAFDMLIADFGKHEDNWKWAAFKQPDGGTLYRPIPRDRDQAFTQWNGLLTYLADREWAVGSIEGFEDHFHDLKSLNWPAKDLDRFLLQGLSREQWQQAARYLQTQLTPAVIDEATGKLPPEIQPLSGNDINRKLKARIQDLPQAVDDYYRLLARRVDVHGSNKGEVFQVDRLPAGQVRVQVFDRSKEGESPDGLALYDRTFKPAETEEISVYGFDGRDVFYVRGEASRSILVRLIGGAGQDHMVDESRVKGLRTLTKVYDVPDTDLQLGKEADNRTSTRSNINEYNFEAFDYNSYQPRFTLFYNRNDGFGVSAGVSFLRQGFRKPGFKNLYAFDIQSSSNGLLLLTGSTRHRYAIGKVDAGAEASFGNYFPYYNFFGIGNDTDISQDRYNDRFYTARYRGFTLNAFLERIFLQRSTLRLGPAFEDYTSNFADNSLLGLSTQTPPPDAFNRPNASAQQLLGVKGLLDLDFRDRPRFARRGVRLQARHESYRQLRGPQRTFGLTQGFTEYYGTTRLGLPITLVLKGGGAKNYGPVDDIPFYKLTSLGLRENLRGYYRNRFTGDASLYVNTELRLALGQVKNGFLPFYFGVFGFYDQGRVYYQGNSPGGWHAGYGGGLYLAPVVETLAFSVSYQQSSENSLIQFGLGFNIDK